MNREFLQEIFPRYTEAMYKGNEPSGKGHEHIHGGFCDLWECRFGSAETYKGFVICANFHINKNVGLHICGDGLWIVDVRYSGKSDFWEYCINHSGMPGRPCFSDKVRHKLERESLEKYLNTAIPDCKLWEMVRERAWDLVNANDRERMVGNEG